jgi:hypothetical protein
MEVRPVNCGTAALGKSGCVAGGIVPHGTAYPYSKKV